MFAFYLLNILYSEEMDNSRLRSSEVVSKFNKQQQQNVIYPESASLKSVLPGSRAP